MMSLHFIPRTRKAFCVMVPLVFCILSVFGCGPTPSSIDTLSGGAQEKTLSHSDGSSSGYQKPGADVRLLTPQIKLDRTGEVVSSLVRLHTGHSSGQLFLTFGQVSEIELLGFTGELEINLGDTQVIELPLELYATSLGRHHLPVNALVELPSGQRLNRAMSIVVQVGKKESQFSSKSIVNKSRSPTLTTPEGRLIKILPADEEIR